MLLLSNIMELIYIYGFFLSFVFYITLLCIQYVFVSITFRFLPVY